MINIKKPLDLRHRNLIPQRIKEYAFHIYGKAVAQPSVNRNLQLYVQLLVQAEYLLREAPCDSPWWSKTNECEYKRKALDELRVFHEWEENTKVPAEERADRECKLEHCFYTRNPFLYTLHQDVWEDRFVRLQKCPAPFFLTYITDNQLEDEIAALKALCRSGSEEESPAIQLLPDDCGLSLDRITTIFWPWRLLGTNTDKYISFGKCDWGKFSDEGRLFLGNEALLGDFEDRYTLRPVFVTEHYEHLSQLQTEIEQGEIDYLLEELKRIVGDSEDSKRKGFSWNGNNKRFQCNINPGGTAKNLTISDCLRQVYTFISQSRLQSQPFGDAVWTAPIGGYTIPWCSDWRKLANRDIYIFKFGECTSEELTRQLLDVAAAIVRDIGKDSPTRIEAAQKLNFVIMIHKISSEVSKNDIQLLKLYEFFKDYVSKDTLIPEALKSVYEDYLRQSKHKAQNPYIVEPIIRRNSWCLLTGEEGTGKTYLGMALGAAIAGNGSLFWDWKVRRRNCKVLYITDDEMSEEVIQDRLKVLEKLYPSSKKRFFVEQVRHLSLLDEENFKDTGEKTNKETGKERIENLLLKYSRENDDSPVEVLFLDHLLKLSGAEGDQKEHWPKIRSWIEELTRRGLSVVLLHHEYGGGKMLGTRLIANDTPARIHLQPLHELKPKTKSEREESKYSDEDFVLEEDEVGFGLSIIKNRGGRDQKEPRILKLNIGKYPNWNTPDDENSYSESAPLWKTLSKAERLSHIRKLRNEGQTNAKIAKMFNISKSCIEKYVALLSETEKHYKGPKPQNRRDSNEASTDPALTTDHES